MGEDSSRPIRIAALAAGGFMILMALLSGRLGLSQTDGLGTVEALALVFGLGFVVLGWAGSRTPALYRGTALILLNTIVLLGLVELGSAVLLSVIGPRRVGTVQANRPKAASYYATQSWGDAFWQEFDRAKQKYHPYQLWRMAPVQGQFIHVGPDGLRQTPGAECAAGAYVVDVFGGSTVWGYGVPDWGTVPAYLQTALRQALQRPMCVRNFGQLGGNSTQDVIALVRELQAGRIPDVAVFLGGVNEVLTAFGAGEAGAHVQLEMFAARFEGRHLPRPAERVVSDLLGHLNLYRLGVRVLSPERPPWEPFVFREEATGYVSDTLAASVVRVWLANYRMVEGLGREYGFAHAFFWQPNLLVGRKPLTEEERRNKDGKRPVAGLVELVDQRLASVGPSEYRTVHNLVNVFAGDSAPVYIDWHHLTPEGNRIVANAIAGRLVADAERPRR